MTVIGPVAQRNLQRTFQEHLAAVGGNHLHRGDFIDGRGNAASRRRRMAWIRHPACQPSVATVATYRDHR